MLSAVAFWIILGLLTGLVARWIVPGDGPGVMTDMFVGAVGAVIGACSILMAWYGVNFVLGSGLHTYGEGVGGVRWALRIVGANWTFVILAALRYRLETWAPEKSQ